MSAFNIETETDSTNTTDFTNQPISSAAAVDGDTLVYNQSVGQFVYGAPVLANGNNTFTTSNTFAGQTQIGQGASFISQWVWGSEFVGVVGAMSNVTVNISYPAFSGPPRIIATPQSNLLNDPALAVTVLSKTATSATIRINNFTALPTSNGININWTAEL